MKITWASLYIDTVWCYHQFSCVTDAYALLICNKQVTDTSLTIHEVIKINFRQFSLAEYRSPSTRCRAVDVGQQNFGYKMPGATPPADQLHRHALQQLMQTLRSPNTPEQRNQILQILKSNPPLMADFIRRRQQQHQQQQQRQQQQQQQQQKHQQQHE